MKSAPTFSREPVGAADIEPVVPVAPFSILNASFLIRLLADAYPEGTIIYPVVNPVGGAPERLVGRTRERNITFIGRNTGAFGWLARDLGIAELYELPKIDYRPFGGKYVYPEFIGRHLAGEPLAGLGTPCEPTIIRSYGPDAGDVVHIDNFGIAKIAGSTTLFSDMGVSPGAAVNVLKNGRPFITARHCPSIMDGADGEWVVCQGSSLGGLPELCRVRRNGFADGNLAIGDSITFETANTP